MRKYSARHFNLSLRKLDMFQKPKLQRNYIFLLLTSKIKLLQIHTPYIYLKTSTQQIHKSKKFLVFIEKKLICSVIQDTF